MEGVSIKILGRATLKRFGCVKPRANGGNIVGQQHPTLLDATCCVRLYTLLLVVGCYCAKFETGQTFSYVQTDATTPNNVGSCCVRLHGAKSLTGFKLCAITIPNNTQQQTCNRVCKFGSNM